MADDLKLPCDCKGGPFEDCPTLILTPNEDGFSSEDAFVNLKLIAELGDKKMNIVLTPEQVMQMCAWMVAYRMEGI